MSEGRCECDGNCGPTDRRLDELGVLSTGVEASRKAAASVGL